MWILSAMAVALQLLLLLRWPGRRCSATSNSQWRLTTALLYVQFWIWFGFCVSTSCIPACSQTISGSKQTKTKKAVATDTSWKSLKLRQCRLAHIAAAAAYVTAWRRHLAATLRIWTFSHQKKIWKKHSLTTEGMRTMQVYTEWKVKTHI